MTFPLDKVVTRQNHSDITTIHCIFHSQFILPASAQALTLDSSSMRVLFWSLKSSSWVWGHAESNIIPVITSCAHDIMSGCHMMFPCRKNSHVASFLAFPKFTCTSLTISHAIEKNGKCGNEANGSKIGIT